MVNTDHEPIATATDVPAAAPAVGLPAFDDEVLADTGNVFAGLVRPEAREPSTAANDASVGSAGDDAEDVRAPVHASIAQATSKRQMSRDMALTFNVIGPRLIAARELSGITQTNAARLVGMANSTQWSLYEGGRRAPPLHVILSAAKALGVSLDFIFWMDDDPERSARKARRNSCVRATSSMLLQIANDIASLIDSSDNLSGPDAQNFRELLSASRELTEAVANLHRLNVKTFESARGGATVLAAAERLGKLQLKCTRVLAQHDAEVQAMAARLVAIRLGQQEDDLGDEAIG